MTWCFIKIDEKSHLDEWNVKQNHDWCPLMLSCLQCTGQSQTLKVRDNKVCVVKRWAVIKIDEKRSRICTYYISSNFLWYAWKFEKKILPFVQVILFEIDCAIFYANLHESFCQFITWTNWVNSGKFVDNYQAISRSSYGWYGKLYDDLIIINLYSQ